MKSDLDPYVKWHDAAPPMHPPDGYGRLHFKEFLWCARTKEEAIRAVILEFEQMLKEEK